jgi:hypothetical protein
MKLKQTVRDLIVIFFQKVKEARLSEIVDAIKRLRGSTSSALSRGKGTVFEHDPVKHLWKLKFLYYLVRHTKTSRYKSTNISDKTDIEVDADIEGHIRSDKVFLKARRIDPETAININLQLLQQISDVLEDNFLPNPDAVINITRSGTEILDTALDFERKSYNESWKYKIKVTTLGDYNFKGTKTIHEKDLYK